MITAMPSLSHEIGLRYKSIRRWSIKICEPLTLEDYSVQPAEDVSPPKWHLGHSTWFFENFILVPFVENYNAFDTRLNWFFNSYYESQGPRISRAQRGNMTRPSVERIMEYRKVVDANIVELLNQYDEANEKFKDLLNLLEVGLQHEQQHQELLLSDIKYILGNNPLFPSYLTRTSDSYSSKKIAHHYLEMEEGLYNIGHNESNFCWDNEQSYHKVYLSKYAIGSRLITNGEYLEFMETGGYSHHEYWLSEGWEWLKGLEVKAPMYWFRQDENWSQYTSDGIGVIDKNAPVMHVNYFEADAFAQWKGARLATEFEWEAACMKLGKKATTASNFLESESYSARPARDEADDQFLGHCWEWTASSYLPYPRYPRFKGALGEYNGKFMVNQMVLRGGSCATPLSHIRPTYRNFFPTDKRWQFTGIRLAKDI